MSATAPSSEDAALRVGQVVARRYRLEELLGTGATGAVYRAAHPGGHAVAVKILDKALMQSEVAQRFVRESQLMLSIHHPNVVRTLAAGRDDDLGVLYLVMPLLSGEDLDGVIQRHGALDPTAAVRITIQAAHGIAAAHRLGVVHRDIKPGNLFLDAAKDGRLFVRVCDFGIAKGASGGGDVGITRTGTQLGTPDYISPEQLKDSKTVDHRADIWGLGATLYELLSGAPPFAHHGRVFDVIAAILGEEIPWLQDRAPWIDAELASAVHRALQRDRNERFQSMDEFIEALLPHSNGDSSLTRHHLVPVSPILRKVKKPRGAPPRSEKRPAPSPRSANTPTAAENASNAATPAKRSEAQPPREPQSRPEATSKPSRVGWYFGVLLLLAAVAVAGALVSTGAVDWRPLLHELIERVAALTTT